MGKEGKGAHQCTNEAGACRANPQAVLCTQRLREDLAKDDDGGARNDDGEKTSSTGERVEEDGCAGKGQDGRRASERARSREKRGGKADTRRVSFTMTLLSRRHTSTKWRPCERSARTFCASARSRGGPDAASTAQEGTSSRQRGALGPTVLASPPCRFIESRPAREEVSPLPTKSRRGKALRPAHQPETQAAEDAAEQHEHD